MPSLCNPACSVPQPFRRRCTSNHLAACQPSNNLTLRARLEHHPLTAPAADLLHTKMKYIFELGSWDASPIHLRTWASGESGSEVITSLRLENKEKEPEPRPISQCPLGHQRQHQQSYAYKALALYTSVGKLQSPI